MVVAGHDRPLRELFLQVFRCQENVLPGEDEIVYDRLDEHAIISISGDEIVYDRLDEHAIISISGELAALVSH